MGCAWAGLLRMQQAGMARNLLPRQLTRCLAPQRNGVSAPCSPPAAAGRCPAPAYLPAPDATPFIPSLPGRCSPFVRHRPGSQRHLRRWHLDAIPRPTAPTRDLKDTDAYNRSVEGVNAYRQAIRGYIDCLVKEANADIASVTRSANAARQAAVDANEKIASDVKAANEKFK